MWSLFRENGYLFLDTKKTSYSTGIPKRQTDHPSPTRGRLHLLGSPLRRVTSVLRPVSVKLLLLRKRV